MSRSPHASRHPARRLRSLVGMLAAALALSGCANSAPSRPSPTTSASASGSASASTPSAGAAPSADQTPWAGDVCISTSTLKSDLQGLATAATTGGGNAHDDAQGRPRQT
ncbi:hypothetical protein E3T26_05215 [Cryobacterium sp. TMT1-21]|uniref:Uncharacterized protein n=1 Tax=Cryobacterium shii TaxID=1259235 RepID=A0AAQ2HGM8_9MICO|nr:MULTISPECIES: hypothetical protein [Cryobacterium]TFC51726.1 hypothetical protein E3O49_03580 [Cryobacterium shii]TFC89406.1 hypothetical protein E3T24_00955 [Cryobacterium sp. TmT2-59]TFD13693.1 hypothetical protein E3T42_13590 [Cryobacterium sp. TMT4-10]TFD15944.1 hypothetical protein E3T26_05215 [Cryobacterium sp. TMT1-21]TFD19792.1 hypothetical protein E3T32_10315 [Cryobacterium sp. TMT2-23]